MTPPENYVHHFSLEYVLKNKVKYNRFNDSDALEYSSEGFSDLEPLKNKIDIKFDMHNDEDFKRKKHLEDMVQQKNIDH